MHDYRDREGVKEASCYNVLTVQHPDAGGFGIVGAHDPAALPAPILIVVVISDDNSG